MAGTYCASTGPGPPTPGQSSVRGQQEGVTWVGGSGRKYSLRVNTPWGLWAGPPGAGSRHPAPAVSLIPCRLAQPSSRSAIVFHLSKLFASGPEVPGKLSSCGAHWVSQGPSQGLHRPCSKSSIFAASLQRREPPFRCRNKSWSHK